jgi:sugar transferase (PEP-CTERM system associated)
VALRIFRHYVPVAIIILSLCEFVLLFVSWRFYLFRPVAPKSLTYDLLRYPSLQMTVLAGVVMITTGMYHNEVFANRKSMILHIIVSTIVFFPASFIGLIFLDDAIIPGFTIWEMEEALLIIWLLCIVLARVVFFGIVDLDLLKVRVLVLGTANKAARIAELAAKRANRHFLPVAYLSCGGEPRLVTVPTLDFADADPDAIASYARKLNASEIVVATDDRRGLPVHGLLRCRTAGIRVIDYLDFIERETKRVDLAALQPGWLIFSDGFRASRGAKACKRVCDILFSAGLLLLTLPIMLVTAVLIVLDSPGPVLYRQTRVGLGGRVFVLLKFRSMRADAEQDGAPRWALAKDPRVTRIGHLIRKLRIDELPQLFNVLRGDMSFVGPRPERPSFVDDFVKQIPFYAERHSIKPGITGWAQINYPYGACLEDARNKLSYDIYYVKNHGLFLDLVIILQTIRVILWADGAR